MASDESAGSDEPNPSDDGWVNPRRPLTRPILSYVPGCYKSDVGVGGGGGGGRESLTVVQGKRKARIFPPSPSRPLVVPIEYSDGEAPCPDAKPTAKKPRSDGLSGCVTEHDLKDRFQQILDRDAAAAAAAAEADTESNMDSPEPLPAWMMTGETWEACKAEAERQMKEEGIFGLNSPDYDELNSSKEIEKV